MAKESFGLMSDDEKMFWKKIGDKIFECRKKHLLTQEQLGQKIGLTRCSMANIEGGRQRMTAYKLHQIEQILWDLEKLK